jgi:hypothetical protein
VEQLRRAPLCDGEPRVPQRVNERRVYDAVGAAAAQAHEVKGAERTLPLPAAIESADQAGVSYDVWETSLSG